MPDGESMKIEKVKDKLSKKLDKENGDNKDKIKIKKADDKVGDEIKKEEEGEKSDHDKKIDKKKEDFSKNVKDIMKGIRNSPQDKEELAKETRMEKKKVVIKDVLGDMKTSIHEYRESKDKIDKGVDDSGKKFQTDRAEKDLGDIK